MEMLIRRYGLNNQIVEFPVTYCIGIFFGVHPGTYKVWRGYIGMRFMRYVSADQTSCNCWSDSKVLDGTPSQNTYVRAWISLVGIAQSESGHEVGKRGRRCGREGSERWHKRTHYAIGSSILWEGQAHNSLFGAWFSLIRARFGTSKFNGREM
jgi:hypothetical protein